MTSGGTNFTNFLENRLTRVYAFFSNCVLFSRLGYSISITYDPARAGFTYKPK